MKKNLLTLVGAATLALGLGSCAYDPYYSGMSGTAVSVGYGYGHGYGGSAFSTSYFWGTGNSAWAYDPYVRCYYHYGRRAYYDPYLCGYYPVGYRPRPLSGVPHPHGYRQGWCPPPNRVTNVTVSNYHDRQSAYRNTNHSWARRVEYDNRPQRVPAAPTRSRGDNRVDNRGNGGSNPFFGGFTNAGGGNARGPRNPQGSTFQPRGNTFQQPPREVRPAPTRPAFGNMPEINRGAPDTGRGMPDMDRGRGRPDATPRMERPPREFNRPEPSPRAADGGGREARRRERGGPTEF